jgi:heavy metal efflux system protein
MKLRLCAAVPVFVCAFALAGVLLDRLNVGLNTMTLGGLAIAVGLLVDAAIIVTENIIHRLTGTSHKNHKEIAVRAATEVGRPIAFATIIVIAVFLPLFGMSGIEGRMYQPLAAAVMAAVAASLLLALSVVPVVGALVLRPKKSGTHEDVWLIRKI